MNENNEKKVLHNSEATASCAAKNGKDMFYRTGLIAGKMATGVGIGAIAGLGTVVAAAFAEVTLPVLFVLKVFGLTGGAVGLLNGMKRKSG